MKRLTLTLCVVISSYLGAFAPQNLTAQQPQTSDVSGTQPLMAQNVKYVQGVGPGYWVKKSSGLDASVTAGTCYVSGAIHEYAGGAVTVTDNATSYVYLDISTCDVSQSTTDFNSGIPIAELDAVGGEITAIRDRRTVQAAIGGTGGGGGSSSFAAITSGTNLGADMKLGSGSKLEGVASGTEVVDFSKVSPPNFKIALDSGTPPTADGTLATNTTSHALEHGANGSTKTVADWAGDISCGTPLVPVVCGIQGLPVASLSLSGGDTGKVLTWNGSAIDAEFPPTGISGGGAGVNNTIPKWTGASSLGLSLATDDATTFAYPGLGGIAAIKFTTTGSAPGLIDFTEGTAPSGVAGHDLLWADSTAHWWSIINHNGSTYQLVGILGSGTIGHCATFDTAHSITDSGCTAGTVTHTGTLGSGELIFGNSGADIIAGNLSGEVTTAGSGATTIAANAVTSAKMAVVNTRRVCTIVAGADNASAVLVDADIAPQGRQCFVPAAATVVEVDVAADAGTPSVQVNKITPGGSQTNLLSGALSTAASGGVACSNTGGTTGIDATTTCTSTLTTTALAAGVHLETRTATAGGVAKRMSISIVYTIN